MQSRINCILSIVWWMLFGMSIPAFSTTSPLSHPMVFRVVPDSLPAYINQSGYRTTVSSALRLQMQADSLQRVVEAKNLALVSAPETEKAGIRIAIRDNNAQAIAMQKKAEEWFVKASEYETGTSNKAVVSQPESTPPSKEVIQIADQTPPMSNISAKPEAKSTTGSEFAILASSPYSASNAIPVDQSLPDGVVYKIQLGAFSKPLAANAFKGLTPISGEKLANGVTKYYVGLFRQYTGAEDALRRVKEYGYKDAYIVAFYNKKTITPARAQQLEKQ